jgi:hypothetical protein
MIQIWLPKHPFGFPAEQILFHRATASCPPTYNATSKLPSDTRFLGLKPAFQRIMMAMACLDAWASDTTGADGRWKEVGSSTAN